MRTMIRVLAMTLALVAVLALVGCDSGIAFDTLREKYEALGYVYSEEAPEVDEKLEYSVLPEIQEALAASDLECKAHYFSKEFEYGGNGKIKATAWFVLLEYDSAKTVKAVIEETEGIGAILRDQVENQIESWNYSYDRLVREKYIIFPIHCPRDMAQEMMDTLQS
ncbi:MAG: hypothetical protein E7625_00445 [Ruminococcaceae bacterium]|nr:hypothetical protein [Oscillospiraceae bacterium]